jgi:hypothetical protein
LTTSVDSAVARSAGLPDDGVAMDVAEDVSVVVVEIAEPAVPREAASSLVAEPDGPPVGRSLRAAAEEESGTWCTAYFRWSGRLVWMTGLIGSGPPRWNFLRFR